MRAISISAFVILLLAAIAALAEPPRGRLAASELPPNGYVNFQRLPAPVHFAAAHE